jgi:phosphoserine phosphatase
MNGELPLDAVYGERIAQIRPTRAELAKLGAVYVEHAIAGARELIATLHAAGVTTAIVSGGIRAALLPLAGFLGIPDASVHAVSLASSANDEVFDVLDGVQPLATQSGKITVVQSLMASGALPGPVAFTGDGATDAAVRDLVDAFFAFTQVARRPAVVAAAHGEATSMAALTELLLS